MAAAPGETITEVRECAPGAFTILMPQDPTPFYTSYTRHILLREHMAATVHAGIPVECLPRHAAGKAARMLTDLIFNVGGRHKKTWDTQCLTIHENRGVTFKDPEYIAQHGVYFGRAIGPKTVDFMAKYIKAIGRVPLDPNLEAGFELDFAEGKITRLEPTDA